MNENALAALLFALTLVWLYARNRNALIRYRAALDGRPATFGSKCAWALSLFAPFTGPVIPLTVLISLALALRARSHLKHQKVAPHQSKARTQLALERTFENALVVSVAAILLVVALLALSARAA